MRFSLFVFLTFPALFQTAYPADATYNRELIMIFDKLKDKSDLQAVPLKKDLPNVDFLVTQAMGLLTATTPMAMPPAVLERADAALCVTGTVGPDELRSAWLDQLRDNLRASCGLFREEEPVIQEWLGRKDFQDNRERELALRKQVFLCLSEVKKLLLLLKKEQFEVKAFQPGKELFSDAFSNNTSFNNWIFYGDGGLRIVGGRLQYADPLPSPDSHLWTKTAFSGDILISFDFEPMLPFQGGQITSYCALPRFPAEDLSGSGRGTMDDYFRTISCYHFSLARDKSGVCNMRKTGPGLWMCATTADPCAQRAKSYHVEIAKINGHHYLFVDRKLVHHYLDAGVYGDSVLTAGHVGLRNWSGLSAWYDNFSVRALVPAKAALPAESAAGLVDLPETAVPQESSYPELSWKVSGMQVLTKVYSGAGDYASPFLGNTAALLAGAPVKIKVWNVFQEDKAFNLDWSARNREWVVKPDTMAFRLTAGGDTTLEVKVQLKNKDSLTTPLLFVLKTPLQERPLATVQSLDVAPRLAKIVRASKAIEVDGLLNEPEWAQGRIPDTLRYTETPLSTQIETYIVYDNWHVCLGLRSACLASLKDEVEFYLSPLGKGYIKVVFDSKGNHKLKNELPVRGEAGKVDYHCAVKGSSEAWTAEVAIPYDALKAMSKPGDVWRMNYSVVRHLKSGKEELGTWCGDFNAYWEFGYLLFE